MFSTSLGWKMLYCAMEIYNEKREGREGEGLLLPVQSLMERFSLAFLHGEGIEKTQSGSWQSQTQ